MYMNEDQLIDQWTKSIQKEITEKIVSIEAIRNSGLAGLANGLRRILFDSFKDTTNLKKESKADLYPQLKDFNLRRKYSNRNLKVIMLF